MAACRRRVLNVPAPFYALGGFPVFRAGDKYQGEISLTEIHLFKLAAEAPFNF